MVGLFWDRSRWKNTTINDFVLLLLFLSYLFFPVIEKTSSLGFFQRIGKLYAIRRNAKQHSK